MWMARVASNGLILGCGVRPSAFGPCPLWVRLRSDALSASRPVYPDQQTSLEAGGRSQKSHNRTFLGCRAVC